MPLLEQHLADHPLMNLDIGFFVHHFVHSSLRSLPTSRPASCRLAADHHAPSSAHAHTRAPPTSNEKGDAHQPAPCERRKRPRHHRHHAGLARLCPPVAVRGGGPRWAEVRRRLGFALEPPWERHGSVILLLWSPYVSLLLNDIPQH